MNGLGRRLRLGCSSDIPACAARSGVELEPGRRLTDSAASSESDKVKSTTAVMLFVSKIIGYWHNDLTRLSHGRQRLLLI